MSGADMRGVGVQRPNTYAEQSVPVRAAWAVLGLASAGRSCGACAC